MCYWQHANHWNELPSMLIKNWLFTIFLLNVNSSAELIAHSPHSVQTYSPPSGRTFSNQYHVHRNNLYAWTRNGTNKINHWVCIKHAVGRYQIIQFNLFLLDMNDCELLSISGVESAFEDRVDCVLASRKLTVDKVYRNQNAVCKHILAWGGGLWRVAYNSQ